MNQLHHTLEFVCVGLSLLAASIYTTGFFPDVRKSMQTVSTDSGISDNRCANRKTILMVIDALRLDAMLTSAMPFLSKAAIDTSVTCSIGSVRVQMPTVTLPRIKCMATGRVPGFLDVLWNFFATELAEDSLIRRWRSANRSVHFYGDDTWTKLFPGGFTRSVGVASFFATDFYDVDNNVTQNLAKALAAPDSWDVMILHYLGLDHIGHIEGPNSPLIPGKLAEMDSVIRSIVDTLKLLPSSDWLLVVTGDHGMSDLGGHGGASLAETRTPLVLIHSLGTANQKQPARPASMTSSLEFEQPDMTGLLAAWTGVPSPRGSLGLLHPELAGLTCGSRGAGVLSSNWLGLIEMGAEAAGAAAHFNRSGWSSRCVSDPEDCYATARRVQHDLIYASAEYSLPRMLLGLALGCLACSVRFLLLLFATGEESGRFRDWLLPKRIDCGLVGKKVRRLTLRLQLWGTCLAPLFVHASTSLVEEEHQLWYFACSSLCLCLLVSDWLSGSSALANRGLLLLAALRVGRSFNQTGDKWANLPDLDDALRQYPLLFACLTTASVSLVCLFADSGYLATATSGQASYACRSAELAGGKQRDYGRPLLIGCAACAAWLRFRQLAGPLSLLPAPLAGLDFLPGSLGLLLAGAYAARTAGQSAPRALTQGLLLALITLCRPVNCTVLALHCWTVARVLLGEKGSSKSSADSFSRPLACYWLGQAAFFQLGQSNNLATVDIASAFAALPFDSMPLGAGILIVNTWSGNLLYLLFMVVSGGAASIRASRIVGFAHLLSSFTWCFVALFCLIQRHHLFVWTVYAPKYCYASGYLLLVTALYLIARLFNA